MDLEAQLASAQGSEYLEAFKRDCGPAIGKAYLAKLAASSSLKKRLSFFVNNGVNAVLREPTKEEINAAILEVCKEVSMYFSKSTQTLTKSFHSTTNTTRPNPPSTLSRNFSETTM